MKMYNKPIAELLALSANDCIMESVGIGENENDVTVDAGLLD